MLDLLSNEDVLRQPAYSWNEFRDLKPKFPIGYKPREIEAVPRFDLKPQRSIESIEGASFNGSRRKATGLGFVNDGDRQRGSQAVVAKNDRNRALSHEYHKVVSRTRREDSPRAKQILHVLGSERRWMSIESLKARMDEVNVDRKVVRTLAEHLCARGMIQSFRAKRENGGTRVLYAALGVPPE